MLFWLLLRTATALVNIAPLKVSYALARVSGTLTYNLWRNGRARAVANMRHVTRGNDTLARRYARQSFANYAVFLVDFLRSIKATPQNTSRRVVFDRWNELKSIRGSNGIVFVTLHFGNWDMGAAALALNGFPITVVADGFDNPRIDRLVRESREHLGMTVIPADRTGPGILRALRRNEVVATLADVPAPPDGGIEVEFFGDMIRVHDGAARLALRAGATVIAATMPRQTPWSDRVEGIIEPITFQPTGDSDRDIKMLTQAIFNQLEGMVRLQPSQWYIFRNLWTSDACR